MRQTYVKNQFDAAIRNVESALEELADRLHSRPVTASPRSSLRHAGRTLRRKAGSLADHVPFERASEMAADAGRVVRHHPVKTVVTAAIAGYCIWTLIQYSASRAGGHLSRSLGPGRRNPSPALGSSAQVNEVSGTYCLCLQNLHRCAATLSPFNDACAWPLQA
jgi:ElaB/YqjD/DUF883 family membrane-anchored ribosome-binding protein